eukprot:Rmarinus@m.29448
MGDSWTLEEFLQVFIYDFGWSSCPMCTRPRVSHKSNKSEALRILKKLKLHPDQLDLDSLDYPLIRDRTFKSFFEWIKYNDHALSLLQDNFEDIQVIVLSGVTDVWSAVRKSCASRVAAMTDTLSLAQMQCVFSKLFEVCEMEGSCWYWVEGALVTITALLRKFQWGSLDDSPMREDRRMSGPRLPRRAFATNEDSADTPTPSGGSGGPAASSPSGSGGLSSGLLAGARRQSSGRPAPLRIETPPSTPGTPPYHVSPWSAPAMRLSPCGGTGGEGASVRSEAGTMGAGAGASQRKYSSESAGELGSSHATSVPQQIGGMREDLSPSFALRRASSAGGVGAFGDCGPGGLDSYSGAPVMESTTPPSASVSRPMGSNSSPRRFLRMGAWLFRDLSSVSGKVPSVSFALLSHPQLSVRECATKALAAYLTRSPSEEAVAAFDYVLSRLCRVDGAQPQNAAGRVRSETLSDTSGPASGFHSPAATADATGGLCANPVHGRFHVHPRSCAERPFVTSPYEAEGFLGVCALLVKLLPAHVLHDCAVSAASSPSPLEGSELTRRAVWRWRCIEVVLDVYLQHAASTVRQMASRVAFHLASKSGGRVALLLPVIRCLAASWVPPTHHHSGRQQQHQCLHGHIHHQTVGAAGAAKVILSPNSDAAEFEESTADTGARYESGEGPLRSLSSSSESGLSIDRVLREYYCPICSSDYSPTTTPFQPANATASTASTASVSNTVSQSSSSHTHSPRRTSRRSLPSRATNGHSSESDASRDIVSHPETADGNEPTPPLSTDCDRVRSESWEERLKLNFDRGSLLPSNDTGVHSWQCVEGRLLAYELILNFLNHNHSSFVFPGLRATPFAVSPRHSTPRPTRTPTPTSTLAPAIPGAAASNSANNDTSAPIPLPMPRTSTAAADPICGGTGITGPATHAAHAGLPASPATPSTLRSVWGTAAGAGAAPAHTQPQSGTQPQGVGVSGLSAALAASSLGASGLPFSPNTLIPPPIVVSPGIPVSPSLLKTASPSSPPPSDFSVLERLVGHPANVRYELESLVIRMLLHTVSGLAHCRWEVRRIAGQVLPHALDVAAWLDVSVLHQFWSKFLQPCLLGFDAARGKPKVLAHSRSPSVPSSVVQSIPPHRASCRSPCLANDDASSGPGGHPNEWTGSPPALAETFSSAATDHCPDDDDAKLSRDGSKIPTQQLSGTACVYATLLALRHALKKTRQLTLYLLAIGAPMEPIPRPDDSDASFSASLSNELPASAAGEGVSGSNNPSMASVCGVGVGCVGATGDGRVHSARLSQLGALVRDLLQPLSTHLPMVERLVDAKEPRMKHLATEVLAMACAWHANVATEPNLVRYQQRVVRAIAASNHEESSVPALEIGDWSEGNGFGSRRRLPSAELLERLAPVLPDFVVCLPLRETLRLLPLLAQLTVDAEETTVQISVLEALYRMLDLPLRWISVGCKCSARADGGDGRVDLPSCCVSPRLSPRVAPPVGSLQGDDYRLGDCPRTQVRDVARASKDVARTRDDGRPSRDTRSPGGEVEGDGGSAPGDAIASSGLGCDHASVPRGVATGKTDSCDSASGKAHVPSPASSKPTTADSVCSQWQPQEADPPASR